MMMLEGGLTVIVIAVIFALPQLGNRWFASVERVLGRLARRKELAVVCVGLATILIRLAIPSHPTAVPSRRFQPDAGVRHICARAARQSDPCHVDPL